MNKNRYIQTNKTFQYPFLKIINDYIYKHEGRKRKKYHESA